MVTRLGIFTWCLFLAASVPGLPQCQLPEPIAKALTNAPNQMSGVVLERERGLTYLDLRCLDEARFAFQQALIDADKLPVDQEIIRFLLELTDAFSKWHQGDLTAAKQVLFPLSDFSMPRMVNVRAAFALAELLSQAPDPAMWSSFEPRLRMLDERGMWMARRYRLLYGLNMANSNERITALEAKLQQDLSIQERLQDQVILATLLRKGGRLTEAYLLTANIERDIGLYAISPDLRAAYVTECAAIASEQSRAGNHDATVRYQKYNALRGEIFAPK